ncbi:MmgE/PrpD family protein [Castellaniella sp.]|uniref:MmgE/PrpD family protein n=1 Tax=Castellaniella sp. TaxID=1955812 RepID=UPI00355D42E4
MGLSRIIARFIEQIEPDNLPAEVVEKAKACLLNGYGIGMGCHNTPYAPVARQAAVAMNGIWDNNGATLLGDGRRTSVAGAALANSALFHGRAQEDTCGAAHLGAIMIPLLTAMIEAGHDSTADLIPALVAGYEAGGLLEQGYAQYTTPAGLRSSTVYGTIAAAAASARLLRLPVDRIEAALSNAASFSGGLLQSFADGTDEWRYQVGVVGQTGYTATQLARAGSVAAPHAFEGRAGLVRALARVDCDVDALAARLGKEWSILRVTFKPYPVCAFNQTPVIAALALRQTLLDKGLESDSVQKVSVSMNPYETGYAGMDARGPFNSISGTLMSIPFCIANTLLYGEPDMHRMTSYDDPAVAALMERIDLLSDESVDKLCCVIGLKINGQPDLEHRQMMTVNDYAYNRQQVASLIRRVGSETSLPEALYQKLEAFVDAPDQHPISDLLACFGGLPGARR